MKPNENWYEIEDVAAIDSPALIVYPERVQQNIQTLISAVGDTSLLRPHIKTCKAKEPVLLMMKAGITKFKCATIAEAEMLARCNAQDVLLAYQLTEVKLQRYIQLQITFPHTHFSCLVDNLSSAMLFSNAARENGIIITVFIDLNVGMNRTGIVPGTEALTLHESIAGLPYLQVKGLHAYDGHINELNEKKRSEIGKQVFEPVEKLRAELKNRGHGFPLLISGGSPTFQMHSSRENVEVSPGTFVFWDWNYHHTIPEQPFGFGAVIVTRVISLPSIDKVCIDLGHKSIASENPLQKRVFFLNAPDLQPISHSEEHMVLSAGVNHGFRIGDVLYAIPFHICPTVAAYKSAIAVIQGSVEDNWEIAARDRRISV